MQRASKPVSPGMRRVETTEERTSRCTSRDHGFAGTHFPIGRRQNKHRDCRTPTKTKNRREAQRDSQAEMANRSTVEETSEIIAISSVDKRSTFTALALCPRKHQTASPTQRYILGYSRPRQ